MQRALIILLLTFLASCRFSARLAADKSVSLPFLKNSAEECYYLDDFMPIPNNMVAGRAGSLDLRYYTYNAANYKEWKGSQIILSFYSRDERCWSLFEEYYLVE